MILVIAEKEQLGKAIAAAVDGQERTSGSVIYKGDYCITWASGHLLTLKEPQDYDPTYGTWDISALPIYFPDWGVKIKEGREGRIKQISQLIKNADYIIHAGDPDEEGQLIVDEILDWCGNTKPVYRIATSDTSLPALRKALAEKKPNDLSVDLGHSAYARSVADITFGINMSRFFTLNNQPAVLTVGRVQTPTLGLVVSRDQLIESHTKTLFYKVKAIMDVAGKNIVCKYEPAKNDPNLTDGRILSLPYAKSRVSMLANESFPDVIVTKKTSLVQPPLPVDLVELQVYCGKRFGYSPQEVLDTTQTLRSDKYDCITYNRSSCRYLSDNHFDEAPATMATVIKNIKAKPTGLDMTIRSKCFDSEKVNKAAHFAIIPQNVSVDVSKMTEMERNVYYSIVKYYMAQFMPPQKKLLTRLVVGLPDGGRLVSSAAEVLEKGWTILFEKDAKNKDDESGETDDEEDSAGALTSIGEGKYKGVIRDASYAERETKPPARYTQTSLVKDMNAISKYVDDPKVKALLLEKDKDDKDANGSIGTVATQSAIITGLIQHGFLEEDKKHNLISTPLGRELIRILPDEAKKPDLTAYWWAIQEDIRSGEEDYTVLTNNVLELVRKVLNTSYPAVDQSKIPASMKNRGKREPLGACPRCGKPVIEGKKGFGCSGWKEGCKFVLWKSMPKSPVMKNVTFSAQDAKDFLSGKPVLKTNLLSPRTGNTFSMHLKMEDDPMSEYGPNIVFVKEEDTAELLVIGKCPRCGRNVIEKPNNFTCVGKDSGCNFVIWKKPKGSMFENVTFSAANVRDFLAGKKVKKTNLMSKKTGKAFEAYLTMVDDPASPYGPKYDLTFPRKKKIEN